MPSENDELTLDDVPCMFSKIDIVHHLQDFSDTKLSELDVTHLVIDVFSKFASQRVNIEFLQRQKELLRDH